ncbi:MAG: glycosyltransferase [Bacteroidota bacterium]
MPHAFAIASIFFLTLAAGYFFIIIKYIRGWESLAEWYLPTRYIPKIKVSVIIPARNEEGKIIACLNSILKNNYPENLFEIIVVDDHSTDGTFLLVDNFAKKHTSVKVLKLAKILNGQIINSFKKVAIETGIKNAAGELIITTDADCIVPENWLLLITSFCEINNLEFVAGPVNFHNEKSFFEKFQSLDFIGMMGVTGAGIFSGWMNMCNGANLAYTKKIFKEINGFKGIKHLASGDDILLMQKVAAHCPGKVGFLKNKKTTVLTSPKPTIKSFIGQRLRWATKSASYVEWKITFVLAVVFIFCAVILFSFFMFFIDGIKWVVLFSVLFLIKSTADYFFLKKMTDYFDRNDLMKTYLGSQVLHVLYIVVIGCLSNVKKEYKWKGRKVR